MILLTILFHLLNREDFVCESSRDNWHKLELSRLPDQLDNPFQASRLELCDALQYSLRPRAHTVFQS